MALQVLVLDTSAFVMGLNPSALDLPTYSAPSVLDELIPDSLPYARFTMSRDSGRLSVTTPTRLSMKSVEEASSKVGDVGVLSRADFEVLAVALDLRGSSRSPTIVSDDYAIQNVAETLGVGHASLATFGIAKKFNWVYYCPACFRRYVAGHVGRLCTVCGTRLKRKVVKKERVSNENRRNPAI